MRVIQTLVRILWVPAASGLAYAGWVVPHQVLAQTPNASLPVQIGEGTLLPLSCVAGVLAATWWIKGLIDRTDKNAALMKLETRMRLDAGDKQFKELLNRLNSIPCLKPRTPHEVQCDQLAADQEADRQSDRQDDRHNRPQGHTSH